MSSSKTYIREGRKLLKLMSERGRVVLINPVNFDFEEFDQNSRYIAQMYINVRSY